MIEKDELLNLEEINDEYISRIKHSTIYDITF
jgi:hypothetical protein